MAALYFNIIYYTVKGEERGLKQSTFKRSNRQNRARNLVKPKCRTSKNTRVHNIIITLLLQLCSISGTTGSIIILIVQNFTAAVYIVVPVYITQVLLRA